MPARFQLHPLGSIIAGFEAGVSVNGDDRPAESGEPGVLKVSAVGMGRFLPGENKAVVNGDRHRVGPAVGRGDILVTRANTHDLVGAAAAVDADYPRLHLSDKTWRVVLLEDDIQTRTWLLYALNSPPVRAELRRRATGTSGSMKNISQDAYLDIRVPVPPPEERGWIGKVLATWQGGLDRIQALLAAKRRLRRGLMQQLLTGTRRFREFVQSEGTRITRFGAIPESWGYEALADLASEVSRRAIAGDSAPVLACSKYEGLVDSLQYFGRRVFSADKANYKVVRQGQFAFPANHIEEGSIGLLQAVPTGLVSPIYIVFEVHERLIPEFLYAVLKTDMYRHIFATSTKASVDRRGSLRWSEFSRIHVPVPPLGEQQRIVEALASLDREIAAVEKLGGLLDRQKRGLMQQLLTGQIRVKV